MTYDREELLRHREPVLRRGFGGQLACACLPVPHPKLLLWVE